jgi:anti-sigma regulatory factor (Ser/Thr protein kinase)
MLVGLMAVSGADARGILAGTRVGTIRLRGGTRMEVSQASVVLLPCVPSSVGMARGQLSTELRACGIFPATIGDAALVVSELLSNAILHARPLPGCRVRVSWALGPARIELAVSDGGSETLPRAFHPSLSSIGGRGLAIVEHLCSSWGVRSDDLGTTVWAVLPAPQAWAAQ